MKRYAFATALIVLVVFPWQQAPRADAPTYTIQVLGTFAAIGTTPDQPPETGINASGQVSGTVTDATGRTRAVRYNGTAWEFVPGLTWGSTAAGINVHGDIVGKQQVGAVEHAYRYNAATGVIDDIAPLAGGASSVGFGINDNGDVVGQSDVPGGQRGFLAHPGQAAVPLPTLGGTPDQACGINNSGQVAETATVPSSGLTHAVRIEADGVTLLDAGTFDGTFGQSGACAIDETGRIGGSTSTNSFANNHAYRWNPGDPVLADNGLPSIFGNVESVSEGVSAGWYMLADFSTRALMHTDANGAVDLNALLPANSGWVLSQVKGINASGQMVGDGLFNGAPAVFLMGPAKTGDTTPPVIAPHADVTAEATGPGGASVAYTAPGTTDNVDKPGTATCLPASGSTFALGTTPVTCKATDAAGNAATPTTFNVIVKDTTPPVIAPHGGVTAAATAPSGATVTYSAPTTTDAVDGPGTAICSPASGSTFALGTTTVTCEASDAAGNAATPTTFNVTVTDGTAPVISMVYASPDEIWPPNGKMVPVSVMVTATDDVDPSPTCWISSVSGGTVGDSALTGLLSVNLRANNGAVYVLTVTCRDSSGNKATAATNVVVTKTNGNGATPKGIAKKTP